MTKKCSKLYQKSRRCSSRLAYCHVSWDTLYNKITDWFPLFLQYTITTYSRSWWNIYFLNQILSEFLTLVNPSIWFDTIQFNLWHYPYLDWAIFLWRLPPLKILLLYLVFYLYSWYPVLYLIHLSYLVLYPVSCVLLSPVSWILPSSVSYILLSPVSYVLPNPVSYILPTYVSYILPSPVTCILHTPVSCILYPTYSVPT